MALKGQSLELAAFSFKFTGKYINGLGLQAGNIIVGAFNLSGGMHACMSAAQNTHFCLLLF